MAEDLVIRPDLRIPAFELDETMSRSGGPGGQHVNKTSTRVMLRWNVVNSVALTEEIRERLLDRLSRRLTDEGDLLVIVDESRSQLMNRQAARKRLADIVLRALAEERPRVATRPTAGGVRRRFGDKKAVAQKKATRTRPRIEEEDG